MERLSEEEFAGRPIGLKNRPCCENCGAPVKIRAEDYEQDEYLCAGCASDARAARLRDQEYESGA